MQNLASTCTESAPNKTLGREPTPSRSTRRTGHRSSLNSEFRLGYRDQSTRVPALAEWGGKGGGKAAISRLPAIEEAAVPRLFPCPSPPALRGIASQ